jgi:ketosteroid isomerase-like protein
MSEATDVVRAALEAFNESDWETVERHWHPDGIAIGPPAWPETGELAGWQAIRDQFERLKSDWSEDHVAIEDVQEPRPGVVYMRLLWSVKGATSGVAFDVPMWLVAMIRDAKVERAEFFQEEAPARAAAGI